MSHLALLTILFLIGAKGISIQEAGNCLLNFIEQPTTVYCLLYDVERIILKCTISSEGLLSPDPLDPSRIRIKWYFNNGTESELTVGTNETKEGGNGEYIVISSTLTISSFNEFQHVGASLAQGSYYCRVNWGLVSNSSQQFIVLDEDAYLQAGTFCSEEILITTTRESACAIVNLTSSETHATINYQNVTDVMIMQDIDATTFTQSTFNQNKGVSKIWIYILAAMLGAFLIMIVVLVIFILILMIRKPQRNNVDHMYEAVNDNQLQSVTGVGNLEIQVCRAHVYEVEEGTVLMEPNTAYSVPTNDIEMQSCGAYEVEKKSVIMKSNVAYVASR